MYDEIYIETFKAPPPQKLLKSKTPVDLKINQKSTDYLILIKFSVLI